MCQAAEQRLKESRKALGQRLSQLREAACLTQGQLGSKIGYGRTTVGKAEQLGFGNAELWDRADKELAAAGELTKLRAEVKEAAEQLKRSKDRAIQAEARLRLDRFRRDMTPPSPESVGTVIFNCPNCGSPVNFEVKFGLCHF